MRIESVRNDRKPILSATFERKTNSRLGGKGGRTGYRGPGGVVHRGKLGAAYQQELLAGGGAEQSGDSQITTTQLTRNARKSQREG